MFFVKEIIKRIKKTIENIEKLNNRKVKSC